MRILDILASSFLDDLLELREDISKEQQEKNWFSAPSALRIYGESLFEGFKGVAVHVDCRSLFKPGQRP